MLAVIELMVDITYNNVRNSVHTTRELHEFLKDRSGLRLLRDPQPGPVRTSLIV